MPKFLEKLSDIDQFFLLDSNYIRDRFLCPGGDWQIETASESHQKRWLRKRREVGVGNGKRESARESIAIDPSVNDRNSSHNPKMYHKKHVDWYLDDWKRSIEWSRSLLLLSISPSWNDIASNICICIIRSFQVKLHQIPLMTSLLPIILIFWHSPTSSSSSTVSQFLDMCLLQYV